MPQVKRSLTIDDVAQEAGVARVTVSRVLNNEPNVREKTRLKVQAAIEKLGYSVNQQARALASGGSRRILLIHASSPDREPNSYYDSGLELGALRGCTALGYDLVSRAIDPAGRDPAARLDAILRHEQAAGVILPPPLSDRSDVIAAARDAETPVVLISAGESTRMLAPSIGIDDRSAGCAIGEHLLALGHRRIGFLSGPDTHRSAATRLEGFLATLEAAGVTADTVWIRRGDFTFRSGIDAGEELARDRRDITALACANDDMAAGATLALHRAGLRLPEDIHVTGFDDTPVSQIIWPPLTTIRQPIKQFGERAVQLLAASNDQNRASEVIPFELVVRDSTGPVPA